MGSIWVLSAPDWPHVGPMDIAIREGPKFLMQDRVEEVPWSIGWGPLSSMRRGRVGRSLTWDRMISVWDQWYMNGLHRTVTDITDVITILSVPVKPLTSRTHVTYRTEDLGVRPGDTTPVHVAVTWVRVQDDAIIQHTREVRFDWSHWKDKSW